MTANQKRLRELREKQSKDRQKMAELAQVDELSDEQRSELDGIEKSTPDLERQIRAGVVALEDEEKEAETRAADEPDAERRERIDLRRKASLTAYIRAALSGGIVDGAEAELRSAAGVSGIPLELWDVPSETEQRAATEAPGTVGVNLDRIRPAVFANSIAPRLGIEMPRVDVWHVCKSATINASLTAAAKAKGADADATAATFTVTAVTAKRISARMSIRIEDIASVGQANFESILRENLSLVLSDELDNSSHQRRRNRTTGLTGIFERLADPAATTAIVDFDGFAAAHAGGNRWPLGEHFEGCFHRRRTFHDVASRSNLPDGGEFQGRTKSAAAYAMANTGGFWTNKRMPDAATFDSVDNVQQAILYRKGRSMMGGAGDNADCQSAPTGMKFQHRRHFQRQSASGTRQLSRCMCCLGDVILVQPDAYAQMAYQLV